MRERAVFTFIDTDQYRFDGYVVDDGRPVPSGQYHLYFRDRARYKTQLSIDDPEHIENQEHIDNLIAYTSDISNRKTRIQQELQALIGQNVLALTDAQRWKLVAAVFFKLGVINSNGVVQPYSEWVESID